jgi:hypothetical protein
LKAVDPIAETETISDLKDLSLYIANRTDANGKISIVVQKTSTNTQRVSINGQTVNRSVTLSPGDIVSMGDSDVYRVRVDSSTGIVFEHLKTGEQIRPKGVVSGIPTTGDYLNQPTRTAYLSVSNTTPSNLKRVISRYHPEIPYQLLTIQREVPRDSTAIPLVALAASKDFDMISGEAPFIVSYQGLPIGKMTRYGNKIELFSGKWRECNADSYRVRLRSAYHAAYHYL